jgi:type IV secretory pathway protease TraF
MVRFVQSTSSAVRAARSTCAAPISVQETLAIQDLFLQMAASCAVIAVLVWKPQLFLHPLREFGFVNSRRLRPAPKNLAFIKRTPGSIGTKHEICETRLGVKNRVPSRTKFDSTKARYKLMIIAVDYIALPLHVPPRNQRFSAATRRIRCYSLGIITRSPNVVVLAACAVIAVLLFAGFSVMEMGSPSMQPLVAGQGAPPSRSGDWVLVAKWFHTASLRTGDLVVVNIPTSTGRVRTLRKIEQQPDTPAGQFYVKAVSNSGIDSRQFGPFPASNIYGRVIWIIR